MFLSLSLLCLNAQGKKILSYKERTALLDAGKRYLGYEHMVNDNYNNLMSIPNPFIGDEQMNFSADKNANTQLGEKDSQIDAIDLTSPKSILEAAAKQIRPTGVITKNRKRMLVFGTKTIGAGDSIYVNLNGKQYNIVIEEITNDDFTLSLDEFKVVRPIEEFKTADEN